MKRKFLITFLIAVLTLMISFAFATDVLTYDTMLISEETEVLEYDTMLISEEPGLLISPNPNSSNTILVQLDGEYVDFTDEQGNVVNPKIIQNRTMVPMRKIFEIFDAEIDWNNETRTVVATTAEKEITLTINNDVAKLKDLVTNEEKEITLDSAPVLLDNRTMVPVRFIAESLEKEVGWDADQKTVVIIDMEKMVKNLEEKTPALKELFELELEAMESFKTDSEIEGKIVYKDAEDKTNNETIEVTGNLEVNMNQSKEIEMYLDLAFDGKGTIYDSLVEAGYEKIKFGLVIATSNMYLMIEQNGEKIWMNLGESTDMTALQNLESTMTMPKNYDDFVELLKTSLGEIDSTTYSTLKLVLEMLGWFYGEDCLEITTKGDTTTIKMEIDLKKILLQNMQLKENVEDTADTSLEDIDFRISIIQKVEDKKVESAKIDMEISFKEPTTEESFEMDFELDMKYKNVNKDFDVILPAAEDIITM